MITYELTYTVRGVEGEHTIQDSSIAQLKRIVRDMGLLATSAYIRKVYSGVIDMSFSM